MRRLLKAVATASLGTIIGSHKELNTSISSTTNIDFFINDSSHIINRFGDGRDWFFNKRYGMFIHWSIYSIPAWHEQYQQRAKIPRSEYVKYR